MKSQLDLAVQRFYMLHPKPLPLLSGGGASHAKGSESFHNPTVFHVGRQSEHLKLEFPAIRFNDEVFSSCHAELPPSNRIFLRGSVSTRHYP